jgi:hypothetical protein
MTNGNTYRASTYDTTTDGLKPGLGSVGGELDHPLGQFWRQPARESLVRRDDAQLDGYNAAAPDLDADGIR